MPNLWSMGKEHKQSVGFNEVTETFGMAAVDRDKLDLRSDGVVVLAFLRLANCCNSQEFLG